MKSKFEHSFPTDAAIAKTDNSLIFKIAGRPGLVEGVDGNSVGAREFCCKSRVLW